MIGIAAVVQRVRGLDVQTLEIWVAQDWVRPRREAGAPVFEEIDVARVQLIAELRNELEVGDAAMPVVLSLLDQLHGARARVRHMLETLAAVGAEGQVRDVLARLQGPPPDAPHLTPPT
jgi:chaperone modulatory protein CbpM